MAPFKKVKILQSLPNTDTDSAEISAVPLSLQDSTAPDYDHKISLSLGTTYTVGSGALAAYTKGYVLAGCTARSDDSNPYVNFNGVGSYLMGCDTDYGGDLSGYCIFVAVRQGDYFTIPGSGGWPAAWFIPTKE